MNVFVLSLFDQVSLALPVVFCFQLLGYLDAP